MTPEQIPMAANELGPRLMALDWPKFPFVVVEATGLDLCSFPSSLLPNIARDCILFLGERRGDTIRTMAARKDGRVHPIFRFCSSPIIFGALPDSPSVWDQVVADAVRQVEDCLLLAAQGFPVLFQGQAKVAMHFFLPSEGEDPVLRLGVTAAVWSYPEA